MATEAPGAFWHAIASSPTIEAFADHFTSDITFETSSCNQIVRGAADMRTLLIAMSVMYSPLQFTAQNDIGNKTYLEWTGVFQGEYIAGATVFAWDAERKKIASVHLHQRPLGATVRFAADLARQHLPGFTAADFTLP